MIEALRNVTPYTVVLPITWPSTSTTRTSAQYRCDVESMIIATSKLWLPWTTDIAQAGYAITGDGDFDGWSPNGDYLAAGVHNSQVYYTCEDLEAAGYLYYSAGGTWQLAKDVDQPEGQYWESASIEGEYAGTGYTTGTPVSTAITAHTYEYVVSGDGTGPDGDCAAQYAAAGTHNGQPYYQSIYPASWYLWYDSDNELWVISAALDSATNSWSAATIEGTYEPNGTYTGNPIVAAPSWPTDTVYGNAGDLAATEDCYVQAWINEREIIAASPALHVFGSQALDAAVIHGIRSVRPFPFTLRRGDLLRLLFESRAPFLGRDSVTGHLALHGYRSAD